MSDKYVLISVTDKKNIIDIASILSNKFGYGILASGGTGKVLSDGGIEFIPIDEYTGSPEILGGRVKTLHPKIHGGILAKDTDEHREQLDKHNIKIIDIVICNFYDFYSAINEEKKLDNIIESIDIGGPTLVRAAAKNLNRVSVLVDPSDYSDFLDHMPQISLDYRLKLASKAFSMVAHYDIAIAKYMGKTLKVSTDFLAGTSFDMNYFIGATKVADLRYGENAHQSAALFSTEGQMFYNQLHGKKISYNNILDGIGGFEIVQQFDKPACSIIKHRSPCGVAESDRLIDAYVNALECDKQSAFGGVYCFNREIDKETAMELSKMFIDTIFAISYSPEAFDILKTKEKLTILEYVPIAGINHDIHSIPGGILIQNHDVYRLTSKDFDHITVPELTKELEEELIFVWNVCKYVKSNAIVISNGFRTVGIAGGEPSRIDAVKHAIERAGDKAKGAVMASDAYFPFSDSIELAARAGIHAVIVPKGSIRDQDTVDMANKLGVILVQVSVRAFKH
jgi:phosphoribosylaminoimidazolecarboxamide formyltransferase/IMP cyclohydrolase